MNYYRRYVGDYLRDTAELSLREHGAYTLLLDYYYANEKPITGNRNSVYRLVRAMDTEDKEAVDFVLQRFFEETPEGFRQKRVDHEIQVSEKARINGKRGGRPVTGIETGSKTENETELETGNITGLVHPPTTNHQPINSPKSSPRKNKTALPAGFTASEAVIAWAEQKGIQNLDRHVEHFITTCQAKGYKYVDWDAALRNAVTNDWARIGNGGRKFEL